MAKPKTGPVTKERTVAKRGNPAKGPKKTKGNWQPTARIRSAKQ